MTKFRMHCMYNVVIFFFHFNSDRCIHVNISKCIRPTNSHDQHKHLHTGAMGMASAGLHSAVDILLYCIIISIIIWLLSFTNWLRVNLCQWCFGFINYSDTAWLLNCATHGSTGSTDGQNCGRDVCNRSAAGRLQSVCTEWPGHSVRSRSATNLHAAKCTGHTKHVRWRATDTERSKSCNKTFNYYFSWIIAPNVVTKLCMSDVIIAIINRSHGS